MVQMLDDTHKGSSDAGNSYDAACFRELSTAFPGIAHDMRGFLNNIVLNLELLKGAREAGPTGGNMERYRDVALQQVRNLELSIRSLSELFDHEGGPLQSLDLNAVFAEVHAMVRSYARQAKKSFVWAPFENPIIMPAHAPSLRRALLHIELALIRATSINGELAGQIRGTRGRASIHFQGDWDSALQAGLMRTFSEEDSRDEEGADICVVRARESLRAAGGDVRGIGAGEAYIIEIVFACATDE